jgi:hypothetical protein
VAFGARGEVTGLRWGPRAHPVLRVGPLLTGLPVQNDPNPDLTAKVRAALNLFGTGGATLQVDSSLITPGARHDMGEGDSRLRGVHDVQLLGSNDVRGGGLHRHGHDVATVMYYRVMTNAGARNLFVHLTAEGQVTDYDLAPR